MEKKVVCNNHKDICVLPDKVVTWILGNEKLLAMKTTSFRPSSRFSKALAQNICKELWSLL